MNFILTCIVGLYLIYLILVTALLFCCDNKFSEKWYIPLKTASSLCFVPMGLAYLEFSVMYRDVSFSALGALIACAVGDIFLGFYNQRKKKRYFAIGMGSFVVGHLFFILALNLYWYRWNIENYLIPLCVVLLFFAIKKNAHIHMGRLTYFCAAYAFIMSAMVTKAITNHWAFKYPETGLWATGGLLFLASDALLMFLYFYHFKDIKQKRLIHRLNLLTYYAAIFCFCLIV